jgi:hypothetical protein
MQFVEHRRTSETTGDSDVTSVARQPRYSHVAAAGAMPLPVSHAPGAVIGARIQHNHDLAGNREFPHIMKRLAQRLEGVVKEVLFVVHGNHDAHRRRSLE